MAVGIVIPSKDSDEASRVIVSRVALGSIAKYDPVSLVTAETVSTSDVDTNDTSTVFGVALSSVSSGSALEILIFGNLTDPIFTFPINAPLFQSALGPISQQSTTIVGEYFCRVGKSNGIGSIFVGPEAPTKVY